MDFYQLFNFSIPATRPAQLPGEAKLAAASSDSRRGVFITKQSLTTFPGASIAVFLVWQVVAMLFPNYGGSVWVAFVASAGIGTFIWWMGASDPKSNMSMRDKLIAAAVAFVNSLQVFAATVGISMYR